jgi:UDP-N-acetylglucosamine--N-acetylmuramyl-(pentapeptide) pyrophosphoryl-undecaprenol N-acetylglucosamine transferase
MMKPLKRILILAGGTGGHVYPALAIATTMRDKNIDVHWLGIEKGLEAKVVPSAGIPLHLITISGLRGKGLKSLLLAPFRLFVAIKQSLAIIKQLQPDVVLGFGGFVSGPGGIACFLLRKNLVIHEQNARAGFTNRCLAFFAKKILEGFPNTFSANNKVITTGNPVRKEIAAILPPIERLRHRHGSLRLLVLGGSLGAQAINQLMPQVLAHIPESERPLVMHQTGEKNYTATLQNYVNAKVNAEIFPYIADMANAYAWADIVLCRAGASTVAELCVAGVGALLVPFPYAAGDHQTDNANYLVKNGAALLIQQSELTKEKLLDWIKQSALSPEKRLSMAQSAFNLRTIDASEKVLKVCEEICQ